MERAQRLLALQGRCKKLTAQSSSLAVNGENFGQAVDAAQLDVLWGKAFVSEELVPFLLHNRAGEGLPLFPSKKETAPAGNETEREIRKRLTFLDRETRSYFHRRGSWTLAFGYPFLEGRFRDATPVYAPILLIPITLTRGTAGWEIGCLEGSCPIVNPTLLSGFEMFQGINRGNAHDKQPGIHHLRGKNSIEPDDVISILQQAGIKLDLEGSGRTATTSLDLHPAGSEGVSVAYHGIITQFSHIPGLAYQEYEELLKGSGLSRLTLQLLEPPAEEDSTAGKPLRELLIDENHCCYVTDLDVSQQRSLQACSMDRQFLLAGPPGTGKTQVLVNCIADRLLHGKTVLFISQGRTSADELYARMEEAGISQPAVLIRDQFLDTNAFFEKTLSQITFQESMRNEDQEETEAARLKKAYYECSRNIDKHLSHLEMLYQAAGVPSASGKTLHELYVELPSGGDLIIEELTGRAAMFSNFQEESFSLLDEAFQAMYPLAEFLSPEHPLSDRKSFSGRQESDRDSWIASIDQILVRAASLHSKNNLLSRWAEYISLLGQPEQEVSTFFVQLEEITHEMNQAVLLPPEHITHESDLRRMITQAGDSHAWQLRFWKALKSLKRSAADREGVFSYSKRLRYTLHIIDRLREIEQTCGQVIAYQQRDAMLSEIATLYSQVSAYMELWHELQGLDGLIHENRRRKIFADILSRQEEQAEKYLKELRDALKKRFFDVVSLDTRRDEASEEIRTALAAVAEYFEYDSRQLQQQGMKALRQTILYSQLLELEREHQEALSYAPRVHEIMQSLRSEGKKKQELLPHLIKRKNNQKMYQLLEKSWQLGSMAEEITKGRQNPEMASFIEAFAEKGLLDVFPCWVLTLDAALTLLPRKQLFDLVLIDGAAWTEMDIALPLCSRGKHGMIAGDGLFPAGDTENLYAAARHCLEPLYLRMHYRSADEKLFAFTNSRYFGDRVQTAPSPTRGTVPIEVLNAPGRDWIAQAVAQEIQKRLMEHPTKETIGIVAFTSQMRWHIEQALAGACRGDTAFAQALKASRRRTHPYRNAELIVVEANQLADEHRDVMILLPDERIIEEKGEYLFHRALTRADKRAILYIPEEALFQKAGEETVLQKFTAYCRSLQLSVEAKQEEDQGKEPWEEAVYQALRERGLNVDRQVGLSSCTVDLAVITPGTETYGLGIILCPPGYQTGLSSARDQIIWRQLFLETKGWKIYPLWSRNWWFDPESEVERIIKTVGMKTWPSEDGEQDPSSAHIRRADRKG